MTALSILDLAPVPVGATPGDALRRARDLAQNAERFGYNRYWMAEHHNMTGIASAATAVALGFVAETFEPHPDGVTPFGMERDKVIAYSASQYQKRYDRIERARGRTLGELDGDPDDDGE